MTTRKHTITSLLTLIAASALVACGPSFEARTGDAESGAAGDMGDSGAPAATGGTGGTAGATVAGGAGKATGGSAGTVAGAAGAAPRAGATGKGGAGGSAGAPVSVGGAMAAGSAGAPDPGPAGAAGAPETPPPSCTQEQAFDKASLPDAFLLPAYAHTNDSEHVCWQAEDRVCSFSVKELAMDGDTARLSIDEISCDKPLYGGTPKDGMCADTMDCGVLKGSATDQAVVEFKLGASGDGYEATGFVVKGASTSGGVLACDLNASTMSDELALAVTSMVSALSFACK